MPPPDDWSIPELGFSQRREGDEMVGEVKVADAVRIPGTSMIRPAVVAKLADVATGALAHRATSPRIALTVDLAVHTLAVPPDGAALRMVARLVKVGRTTVIGESRFAELSSERPVAIAHATFTPSPRPQDVFEEAPRRARPSTGTGPYAEQVGARIVRPGVAEVDHHEGILQGTGTIQGGVIALIGELAAESLRATPVVALEVRYLSTVRVGPARATATGMGPAIARVEVRDAGNHDRLAALIMARTMV